MASAVKSRREDPAHRSLRRSRFCPEQPQGRWGRRGALNRVPFLSFSSNRTGSLERKLACGIPSRSFLLGAFVLSPLSHCPGGNSAGPAGALNQSDLGGGSVLDTGASGFFCGPGRILFHFPKDCHRDLCPLSGKRYMKDNEDQERK